MLSQKQATNHPHRHRQQPNFCRESLRDRGATRPLQAAAGGACCVNMHGGHLDRCKKQCKSMHLLPPIVLQHDGRLEAGSRARTPPPACASACASLKLTRPRCSCPDAEITGIMHVQPGALNRAARNQELQGEKGRAWSQVRALAPGMMVRWWWRRIGVRPPCIGARDSPPAASLTGRPLRRVAEQLKLHASSCRFVHVQSTRRLRSRAQHSARFYITRCILLSGTARRGTPAACTGS